MFRDAARVHVAHDTERDAAFGERRHVDGVVAHAMAGHEAEIPCLRNSRGGEGLGSDKQDIGIGDAMRVAVFGGAVGQFVAQTLGCIEHCYRGWMQRTDNQDMGHQ